ncbi:MAG: hypothetical protein IKF14_09020 [Atopobiaceae bacterium]|nr:hypothetical protein [Atopobiaceae bacterium]
MKAKDAVSEVVALSGKSAITVSREMGRADTFISMTISRKSVPKLDTFAELAAVCGYELVLMGNGEQITIEYQ